MSKQRVRVFIFLETAAAAAAAVSGVTSGGGGGGGYTSDGGGGPGTKLEAENVIGIILCCKPGPTANGLINSRSRTIERVYIAQAANSKGKIYAVINPDWGYPAVALRYGAIYLTLPTKD
ncbi:hypothetical protein QE152_g25906 [Popillia japonica]|uniref:Uncharacterized protein n=1 Tax=Popillia japonica TaxID=7064 RepID=A0AAW1K0Z1_POPJA